MKPATLRLVQSSRPAPSPRIMALPDWFEPDQDGLGDWARRTFIEESGPLHNPRHAHLLDASIGWLWATGQCKAKDREVAGQCQLIAPMQSKWPSQRQHFQLAQWFGEVPDLLITISAHHAVYMDDWSFCALIEHELCHAAQDVDQYGDPRWNKEGLPILRLVGHDLEEFNTVVERYGARAAGVETMVALANAGPTIGQAQMTLACGTCERKVA